VGNPQDPEIVYGFGPSIKFKKWDFSFFFQGNRSRDVFRSSICRSGTRNARKEHYPQKQSF
jgi:hypothetical protein